MIGARLRLTLLVLMCIAHSVLSFSTFSLRLPCTTMKKPVSCAESQLRLHRLARTKFHGTPDNYNPILSNLHWDQTSSSLRAGKIEPGQKGFVARAQGLALRCGGVALLAFIAYHIALGALKTVVFWICSGALAWSAFIAWKFFKGRKPSGKRSDML